MKASGDQKNGAKYPISILDSRWWSYRNFQWKILSSKINYLHHNPVRSTNCSSAVKIMPELSSPVQKSTESENCALSEIFWMEYFLFHWWELVESKNSTERGEWKNYSLAGKQFSESGFTLSIFRQMLFSIVLSDSGNLARRKCTLAEHI